MRIAFIITSLDELIGAGDYYTALELGAALEYKFSCDVVFISADSLIVDMTDIDIMISMLHDFNLKRIINQNKNLVKIAWARNWFENWVSSTWFNDYDMLMASSKIACRFISEKTGRLVNLLRIATNPERFNLSKRHTNNIMWDVVFTGSNWQSTRDVSSSLPIIEKKHRVAVFGKNWENIHGMSALSHGFIPYKNIHSIYNASLIVIDDANHVTKKWGAANSRVFDALAAGCLVISNSRHVSDEVFSGLLPVYSDAASLSELVDHFLVNHSARHQLLDSLREIVISKHLYRHRAIQLGLYLPQLPRRRSI